MRSLNKNLVVETLSILQHHCHVRSEKIVVSLLVTVDRMGDA